jgi:hypothetical protein
MNCLGFQDKIFEYVDGSLSAGELAAAQEHLAGCSPCHKLVQKERRLAEALSNRLRQSGENLVLHPQIVRSLVAASRPAHPAATEALAGLWMRWLRLAAFPVSLLLVAAFLLTVFFAGKPTRESPPAPAATHGSTPATTDRQRPEVSIQMSYRLPVHEFHQEGNLVVDAFVDETVVVNGTIPSSDLKTLPQKPESKKPL